MTWDLTTTAITFPERPKQLVRSHVVNRAVVRHQSSDDRAGNKEGRRQKPGDHVSAKKPVVRRGADHGSHARADSSPNERVAQTMFVFHESHEPAWPCTEIAASETFRNVPETFLEFLSST
jgi:hypothetical protein